jgi:uncharacterized protein (UPF0332 family)
MTTGNLRVLAEYRMAQAREAIDAAQILLREGSLRASVNRSYYAMFYAVLALLALRKRETSKHGGVIALFNQLFVREGLVPKELSKWLRAAFDLRTQCDYAIMPALAPEEVSETLQHAQDFVARIEILAKSEEPDAPD